MAGSCSCSTMIPMGLFLTSATTAAASARQQEAALQLADSWIEILSNSQPLCRPPSVASDVRRRTTGETWTRAPSADPRLLRAGLPPSTRSGRVTRPTVGESELHDDRSQRGLQLRPVLGRRRRPALRIRASSAPGHGHVAGTTRSAIALRLTEINYPKPGLELTTGSWPSTCPNERPDGRAGQLSARTGSRPFLSSPDLQARPGPPFTRLSVTVNADVTTAASSPRSSPEHPTTCPPSASTAPRATDIAEHPRHVLGLRCTAVRGHADQAPDKRPSTVTVTGGEPVAARLFDEGINSRSPTAGASAVDNGVAVSRVPALMACVTTGTRIGRRLVAWGGRRAAWSTTSLAAATHRQPDRLHHRRHLHVRGRRPQELGRRDPLDGIPTSRPRRRHRARRGHRHLTR